jgi:hypothetical protein
MPKLVRIPKRMEWVLTMLPEQHTVMLNETGWPFPVSVGPSGETQVRVPATQAPNPTPVEPALF